MNSNKMEDKFKCSCTRLCSRKYKDSGRIQSECLYADYIFKDLENAIKLQAELKKGIEVMLPDGRTLKELGTDFFEYRAFAIMLAYKLILNLEKCPSAREIIKDTDHEKIYLEAKEKYSEAIDKLMNISDEDILRLQEDHHYEIDL
ncbi:uncharacterized protein LOC106693878 [Microplitis demolitor]|uniref:uncharacterized protein LOC106693878 n=1 Tax=Microplitis demolitor TaxID=69319 RepID=UPI0004CCD773|nr:uncharacterized protein LOC106693878 [Microplitis demolitor]XP_053595979.1 uncharacterized protein LOC106693878 [Microplitis demolitor]